MDEIIFFQRAKLRNSVEDLKELLRILLIVSAVAIAQAFYLPERIQIDLFLLIVPGLGPAIKILQAVDRYTTTQNWVVLWIEIIYICAMVYFQQWLIRKFMPVWRRFK